jgi:hypothetical protein
MTALQPFRAANAAFISSTSSKTAEPTVGKPGLVKGGPAPPPPMKGIGGQTNVPLPSQEANRLIQHDTRRNRKLGETRLPLAHDFRPRMLRSRDDAPLNTAIRPR